MILLRDFYAAPPEWLAHAPVLMIVSPLIAAAVAALAPNGRWAWVVSIGGAVFAAWMALAVAGEVARHGVVSYALGGFAPPLGIELRIDALGALLALTISAIAVIASLASGALLNAEVRPSKHGLYQAGFLLCVAGMLGLVSTGDAFNAFVFLEVSSIGTYALVAIGAGDRRALVAGFNYLIMGTIGATFYLIGLAFLYGVSGTLNMADMALRLAPRLGEPPVIAGFALIATGLGLKAAMFPLGSWLPGAYAHAPSLISVFLSGAATKAAIYLIIRFAFTIFGGVSHISHLWLGTVLAALGALGLIVGSIQAAQQGEVRRILAYSSIAQVGAILMGITLGSPVGIAAALLHLAFHALMKSSLFLALGGVAVSVNGARLSDFAGVGRTAPLTMIPFFIAALSLVGAPLTAGFLSKWRLGEAMLTGGQGWMLAVLALSSLISVFYVGRMVETMFFRPAPEGVTAREAPLPVLIPLWLLTLATVGFGLNATLPFSLADAAANALMPVTITTGGAAP